jgi:putative PIN family toxin of toxin-antitoxin system
VLDTNILVSAVLSPTGAAAATVSLALRGEVTIVCSPVLLTEFEEVLARFMSRADAADARGVLEDTAYLVDPSTVPPVTRDPDDDHVVAAAIAGDAAWIVTRDKDLLSLESHAGVLMIEPGPFLQIVHTMQLSREDETPAE